MTDEQRYPSGLPDLSLGSLVAVDVETSGLHPDDGAEITSLAIAWIEPENSPWAGEVFGQAFNVQQSDLFSDIGAQERITETQWNAILDWLSSHRIVNHNIKFDLHMIANGVPCRGFPGRDLSPFVAWDTMLAEWVLDPGKLISLDHVSARRLKESDRKQGDVVSEWFKSHIGPMRRAKVKKSDSGYYYLPFDVIKPYVVADTRAALIVARQQIEEFETIKSHLWGFFTEEMDILRILFQMERSGLGYDCEASWDAADDLAGRISFIESLLPFKPTAAEAAKWFYLQSPNPSLPHCTSGATGRFSVRECCVRELIKQGTPWAQEWADYQAMTHAENMWYRGFADKTGSDGKLRTDFRQAGTVSFRFSSSRVNLQALPHDRHFESGLFKGLPSPRKLFRPSPGFQLWELDLSQAELRVGAIASGCKRMLSAIRDGQDLHAVTAHALFGANPGDSDFSYKRQVGKIANFSLLYGVGPDTFRAMVSNTLDIQLTREECSDIVYEYRKAYPEIQHAYRNAEYRAAQKGWVRLVDGRERWFPTWDRNYHKAWNALVQGSIAVNVKAMMRQIYREYGNVLRLQIHDSLVLELPEDTAEATAIEICYKWAAMATDQFRVPMKVDRKCWY